MTVWIIGSGVRYVGRWLQFPIRFILIISTKYIRDKGERQNKTLVRKNLDRENSVCVHGNYI